MYVLHLEEIEDKNHNTNSSDPWYVEVSDGCTTYTIGPATEDYTYNLLADFITNDLRTLVQEEGAASANLLQVCLRQMPEEEFNNLPEFSGF